jgi:VanZ family protein
VGYDPWRGELRGLAIYANELSSADVLRHFRQWVQPKGNIPDLRNATTGYSFAERVGSVVRNEVAFAPDLRIPTIFSVPHKAFLQSPAKEFKASRSYVRDILTNIAGFVPLGLILCAFFTWTHDRWSAIFTAVIACGTLSLVIEILQYYIPPRGSGVTDVITNTLGGTIGALLMQSGAIRYALRRLKIVPSKPTLHEVSQV